MPAKDDAVVSLSPDPLPLTPLPGTLLAGLLGCAIGDVSRLIPGIVLTVAIVAIAILLSDWFNHLGAYPGIASYILIAILLGMVVRNFIGLPQLFQPGVGFSLDKVLKLGIILMGIRLSFSGVLTIGAWSIPIIIGCILTGIVVTICVTRVLKLSDKLGILIAVGTSICGSSAIVAAAPGIKATDDEVTYAVANITVFGIIAMFAYPYLANVVFNGDFLHVGLFLGTAIHNTAQVAGAGLVYDQTFVAAANDSVTNVAVVTKMVRNVMMVAVIPLMAFIYAQRVAQQGILVERGKNGILRLVPLFIIGFLAMAALRSVGDASLESSGLAMGVWGENSWGALTNGIKDWAGYALATAMAGVGLGTSFRKLKGLGLKPFVVGLVSATAVGITSIILVLLLGPLV